MSIVDAAGTIVREVKIASEPEALVRFFDERELSVDRIGLEAGPLSQWQWLHAGLLAAGKGAGLLTGENCDPSASNSPPTPTEN